MNSKHVYIRNYYSFPTHSSKYRVFDIGGFFFFFFFNVFYEIFIKYKKGNQYRITTASALIGW
jgi:hypothetical protein